MFNNFSLLLLLTSVFGAWSQLQDPEHSEHVLAELVKDVKHLKAKAERIEEVKKCLRLIYEEPAILATDSLNIKVYALGGFMYIYTILKH
jgi:hypothetical protein